VSSHSTHKLILTDLRSSLEAAAKLVAMLFHIF